MTNLIDRTFDELSIDDMLEAIDKLISLNAWNRDVNEPAIDDWEEYREAIKFAWENEVERRLNEIEPH